MYRTQSLQLKWSDTTSLQFTVINEVEQVGVLSKLLLPSIQMACYHAYGLQGSSATWTVAIRLCLFLTARPYDTSDNDYSCL